VNNALLRSIKGVILDDMTTDDAIDAAFLAAATARDLGRVDALTDLVNRVYAAAEGEFWSDGATRTSASELATLIAAGEIVAATTRARGIVGVVRVQQLSDDTGEFGMLAAAPEHRGIGVGRALVDFAEQVSRDRDLRTMQLELLVPRGWTHPGKEFLRAWYGRRGYTLVRVGSLDETHPHLAPLLAAPSALEVYEKPLRANARPGARR
jgi:GNAT superfamily N-acetyltransferase